MFVSFVLAITSLVATWMVFRKIGRQGWEGIIPFYSSYVLCNELYGNGWKMLRLLIPFYNIYFSCKIYIDLARGFHKDTGFGLGMRFCPFVFMLILGFGDAQYEDGSKAISSEDFVSETVSKAASKAKEIASAPRKDNQALEKLSQLGALKEKGIISGEEYAAKKEDLLKRV